jgi:hypothetical protein
MHQVKCMYSGHEMPNNEEVVRAYINGKKYRSLLKQKLYDYESLHPYIVSSCRRSHQLYCRLTRRYINNIPEHVERHRSGKKFKRALQRCKCIAALFFTITIDPHWYKTSTLSHSCYLTTFWKVVTIMDSMVYLVQPTHFRLCHFYNKVKRLKAEMG